MLTQTCGDEKHMMDSIKSLSNMEPDRLKSHGWKLINEITSNISDASSAYANAARYVKNKNSIRDAGIRLIVHNKKLHCEIYAKM